MAFLTLSDIEIGASVFEMEGNSTGALRRTVTGALFPDQIHARRAWQVEVPISTLGALDPVSNLIEGRGEHWSFDGAGNDYLYSDGGGVVLGGSPTRATASPAPKYGDAYITNGASTTVDFGADSPYATRWTVSVWVYVSTQWYHVLKTDTGNYLVDGVLSSDPTFDVVSESGGVFTFDAGDYDDLVILPYRVPSTWAEDIANASQAFSDLPKLRLGGDCVGGVETTVYGTYSGRMEYVNTGRPNQVDVRLRFTLREDGTRLGV